MSNYLTSTHIYLKHNNKIKKLNWRKNLSSEDFSYLIKSVYNLQGKILGFQANDGTIYELSYLINHRDHISNYPYQILVKPDFPQPLQYENLIEMKSLKHFEDFLEKTSQETMKLLAVFDQPDNIYEESLKKLDNIAEDYKQDSQFYWLLMSIADRNLSKKAFSLQPPILVFYTGVQKFLEMPINELTLNSITKLLDRIKQEHQSSVYNIDQSARSTESINSFYIIDETMNSQKELSDAALSQMTYVLDSKSISVYELKSEFSEEDGHWAETFDIEEENNGQTQQRNQNNQFEFENNEKREEPEQEKEKEKEQEKNNQFKAKEMINERKNLDFKKKQDDSSNSQASYFLKTTKKSEVSIPKSSGRDELNANEFDEENGSLSPSKYTDFYSLLHDNVGKFEPEEYGMAMCLYKEKDRELFELLNDCRELNDKDLNSFLVSTFARKRFSLWLIDNFSRENIENLSAERSIKNSGVYTAYQCFKYDNDLEDLKSMLEKAINKENKDKGLRKPIDSIVENEDSDYLKGEDSEMTRKFTNLQDLHIIKEGSAKDEESPGMPIDYPLDHLKNVDLLKNYKNENNEKQMKNEKNEKNILNIGKIGKIKNVKFDKIGKNENKYKDMVIAMKDNDNNGKEVSSGFNLILVGNGRESNEKKYKKNGLNINVPSKDEHPLAREVLEKFFDQSENEKNIESFIKLKRKIKLTVDQLEHLKYLYDQHDPALLHLINNFKADETKFNSIEQDLIELLDQNRIDISSSPRSIKKVQIFNLFKTNLEEFYHENRINSTQVKLSLYLFMKIDMSILSAFEVFQLTKDKEDFLDSLNLIYKINYVKFEQQLDDIEEYDNITETQLKIVYAFQTDLELSERSTLETVVKAQDKSLLHLHEVYRRSKNKPEFIRKVKELCLLKSKQLKEIQSLREKSVDTKEEIKNKRKNLVETCKVHRFLKELPNVTMLIEALDSEEMVMEAIFSVYELTLDKQDFTESLRAFYKVRTNERILNLIREIIDEKQWTELDFKIILDAINQGNKVIVGAYQLYDETKEDDDRLELIDTLEKFIKMKKNK